MPPFLKKGIESGRTFDLGNGTDRIGAFSYSQHWRNARISTVGSRSATRSSGSPRRGEKDLNFPQLLTNGLQGEKKVWDKQFKFNPTRTAKERSHSTWGREANQIQESDELLWKQRLYVFFSSTRTTSRRSKLNWFLIPFFHWHRPLFNRQL